MKMTVEQLRAWAASAEFKFSQDCDLSGEAFKEDGHNDDGDPILVDWVYGCAWRTLEGCMPGGEPFELTFQEGVEYKGRSNERFDDSFTARPNTGNEILWKGVEIVDEEGDALPENEQADILKEVFSEYGLTKIDYEALLPAPVTTDVDVEAADLDAAVELITLENDNAPDVRFRGQLVASVSSSDNRGCRDFSGSTGRWAELKLYRTASGRYVCQRIGHSRWVGERTRYTVGVCDDDDGVHQFFGLGWLAKELYEEADMPSIQDVE